MTGTAGAVLRCLAARETVESPVALVAAHPDDETIGAGASLRLFRKLLLVHVTDGAPRDGADARGAGLDTPAAYARARRGELADALAAGGAAPALAGLGAADQAASLDMAGLARTLAALLARYGARVVVTHPYEGGHPDHDATALIARAAAALSGAEAIEMTSYHSGPDGGFVSGAFLPGPAPVVIELTSAERVRKREMLDRFTTQRATLAPFGVEREAFRIAPAADFAAPPHPGVLHYERHDWGMTGPRWRALAAEALRTLGAQP